MSTTMQELGTAQAELERCLWAFVPLFPDPYFRPELVLDPGCPPLPEQLLETTDITLYTRRDLNRPPEEVLTILLHKAIHSYHAFRWQADCTGCSYHTQVFRRLAEQVGFEVVWAGRRNGWAQTLPTAPLRELFGQIALAQDTLVPFRDSLFWFPRQHRWSCGQRRFPDRAELATQLGRCCSDSRRLVRTLRVQRRESSPVVRLAGRWLGPFGFREGTALKVQASYGRLTIEARTFGEEQEKNKKTLAAGRSGASPPLTPAQEDKRQAQSPHGSRQGGGTLMNLAEGQRAVKEVVTDLVQLDQRLLEVAASLPTPPPTGHLRGIIHCVRDDLLKDVIDTLTAAAHKSGAELRMKPERVQ